MEFNVPAKTEEYLSYRYGNDWRVPKKNWDTVGDDGGIFLSVSLFKKFPKYLVI